jgi:ribosomal protein S18 acetylase RimI-like enzyme
MERIRSAEPADGDWLFDLHRAAFRHRVEVVFGAWDEEWQRDAWARRDPRNEVRLVEVAGERAGALHTHQADDGSLYLDLLEVLPKFQGQGIGTRLLRLVIDEAEENGRTVTLRVHKGNPAERLYRRLGFHQTGQTETHLLMSRPNKQPLTRG